jgi:hypothetical protein
MGLLDQFGSGGTDPATRGAAVYSLSELGKEALGREEGNPETVMLMQTLDNLNQATAVAISKESHMNLERVKTILSQLVYGRYVRKIN